MSRNRDEPLPSPLAFPVVGLGASAGGIAALNQFFEALPASTGAAFVLVAHLSPDHASQLAPLLQARTAMPVQQVSDTARIEANKVYVIAPDCSLAMVDGCLHVTQQEGPGAQGGRGAAIDLFFRSLAEAHRQRAISVVLSGAGANGSVGLTRVKELGGIAIAQDPEDAEYPSMPRSAISTGLVDFVLPANDIPQRLLDLWNTASHIHLPQTPDEGEPGQQPESQERALREIMVTLRSRTSHDFRHYKRATVLRRIERRLQVNGLTDLQQYRDYLHLHPDETPALLQDMLISVTNFFRDTDAFEALRAEVLTPLFQNRAGHDPVRVWAPGCATGEEAYSLAMLLQEASSQTPQPLPFQVFATDIDERAVAIARNGMYPESIVADVEPARVRRFFNKDGAHFRVRKELRERVLFALHNVLSDPPFARLDLICCRNLLIYLDRDAQADILRTFHFALRPGGYLFLGSSEAAESASNLFSVVDKKSRLYRANVAARADAPLPLPAGAANGRTPVAVLQPSGKRKFSFGDLHQRLLEQHAPPSVLVSRDSEIVHLSDRTGRFLQYAGGEPSHNIIAAVRQELRLELRTAIYQALQTNHSVEARRVQLERDGRSFFVNMTARPVHDAESNGDFVLILFDEVEDSMSTVPVGKTGDGRDPTIARLESELRRVKERLQATIEQAETSNEELKASNEELQAINEELRSATAELEAGKEAALTRLASLTARPGATDPDEARAGQRAERGRDDFLAVVSHELKHPLNLISASAELISRSPDARGNAVIQRAAATIRRTVIGQAHIIDDLLDMSRLRTGKLSIARAPVDWAEVVDRVCNAIEEDAARKGIKLERSLPPQRLVIDADLTRVEQIVWNLVSNALKYTGDGGIITVTLDRADGDAVLAVRDTGVGIEPQSLPHIFDMFRQGTSPTARQGGLGIGLSLVRELVSMQGGTVRAASAGLGHGAVFTVTFPLREDIAANAVPAPAPSLPLGGTGILLVDDDPGTVETFKLLLEMEGASVTVATSGQEALDWLAHHPADLLLSDIGMPGMSGLDVIRAIRLQPHLNALTAIALSGYGRPDDVRQSMQAGFDAHLTKPVSLQALLDAIRDLRAV
ncbi:CheR family methyltransferase [Cupriavidus sp. TA19]|uniref:CheR family methyltransferase n=1 Tax=Cupriavidus sp. TA19 TaxID=701108 RepID=UPI00295EBA61|nr:CheR family methyltransferase [Cupriavidus sp. TA19]